MAMPAIGAIAGVSDGPSADTAPESAITACMVTDCTEANASISSARSAAASPILDRLALAVRPAATLWSYGRLEGRPLPCCEP